MALSPKIVAGCVAGAGCIAPIPFVIKSGCSIPSLNSRWKRWVEQSTPFLHCKGSKTNIDISLAFRDYEKAQYAEKELYLKGLNKNTGKEVNFDEVVVGQYGTDPLWRLTVFKENGITWLQRLSGAESDNYDDETIRCESGFYEIKKGNVKEDWEESIASITFEFVNNCEEMLGRKECEIKIADTVGLQWSTKFKPKAIFCASS